MRFLLLGCLGLLSACIALTEEEEQKVQRMQLAERRMEEREARYNFKHASDHYKRYHPTDVTPHQATRLHLLEKTIVPRGTSPPRRMGALYYLPAEIADKVRRMSLWSHLCAAVQLAQSTSVNDLALAIVKADKHELIDPVMWFGADPNYRDRQSQVLLNHAARAETMHAAQSLLLYGADIHYRDPQGRPVTRWDAPPEVLAYLLEQGADATWPLLIAEAAGHGNLASVELLIHYGADAIHSSNTHVSPLTAACATGGAEMVRLLISHGANVQTVINDSDIVLFQIVQRIDMDTLRALLENGLDANYHDVNGRSLLTVAVGHGWLDVAQLLLEYGADAGTAHSALSPLWYALTCNDAKMTALLLAHGADAGWRHASTGASLLGVAVRMSNVEGVHLLLQHNASPHTIDRDGEPIIVRAVLQDDLRTTRLLLQFGANVHAESASNMPLLAMATMRQNMPMVELLLSFHADIHWQNERHTSCLTIAAGNNDVAMLGTLLAAGFDIEGRDRFMGVRALLSACFNGATDALHYLLDAVPALRANCPLLLKQAVARNSLAITQVFLANGVHEWMSAHDRERLLHRAYSLGNPVLLAAVQNMTLS